MNWQAADALKVTNAASAAHWCATTVQFLKLQVRAARKRKWPNTNQWAHGEAAKFQYRAQQAAAALGPEFEADLESGKLTVVRRVIAERQVLRLYRAGEWLRSIRLDSGRVTNQRARCVCEKGRGRRALPIRSCGDHATAVVALARALYDQEKAEHAFWKSFVDARCCGTMDDCPLSRAA